MTPPIAEPTRTPGTRRIDSLDAGVRPRLARRGDSEHDVALEPARVLRPDDRLRLEALDLRGDAHREVARVERADPVDAATPGHRRVPGGLRVEPERGDGSETGDDDATHGHESVVACGDGPIAHRVLANRSSDRPTCTPSIPFPPMEAELVRELPDGRRMAVRAEVGRLPRPARERNRRASPLVAQRAPAAALLPRAAPAREAAPATLGSRRRDRHRARRRPRLRRDADAAPSGREPRQQAVGRDSRALHRVRRPRLEGRRGLAASRCRSGARASSAAPSASSSRPRRAIATRRSAGSTASRRSASTA